jgi:hypothetical protein
MFFHTRSDFSRLAASLDDTRLAGFAFMLFNLFPTSFFCHSGIFQIADKIEKGFHFLFGD